MRCSLPQRANVVVRGDAKSAKDLELHQGEQWFFFLSLFLFLLLMVTYYRCALRLHHSRPNEGKQT